jgi:uncharacterized protein YkwD
VRIAGTAAGLLLAAAVSRALAAEPPAAWSAWSASPLPVDEQTLTPLERMALARCGTGEAGLQDTARALVARRERGQPIPELDELARMQRASGEPHPWPRAWVAAWRAPGSEATLIKLDRWLGPKHGWRRRCGVASATSPDGTQTLAVVMVDADADLMPLPTHARTGQWLLVEAPLRESARSGEVVVLGPSGIPRSVPTWIAGRTLRARFALDRPGEFTVQVLADLGPGLRPVLEATVFADVAAAEPPSRAAPGEELERESSADDEWLVRMTNAARASAGLGALRRDGRLDDVASRHAANMVRQGELAHDLGEGDPRERLRVAGIETRFAGENVAHTTTIRVAHRSLWASPSHRANLLCREYDRLGVAVARDDRGDAWVVEVFAGD